MKNIADSVLARLRNFSKAYGLVYNQVLMRYVLERMFYRIGVSRYAGRMILKGGNLFVCWQEGFDFRPTMDADMLFRGTGTPERLKEVFAEICTIQSVDDGLRFDMASLATRPILEEAEYGGVHVTIKAYIGRTVIAVQIDVGVGDAVTPVARRAKYPALLDFPAPELRMYPPETVVAEKFEALVKRGMANSRMKDFYDIWKIKSLFNFDSRMLKSAIVKTFERRKRALPLECPIALTERFANDSLKQKQWQAFLRKSRLSVGDNTLADVIHEISDFLMPVVTDERV